MFEASLFLSGGLVLLGIGAETLVRGSSALALRFGMSPLLVGLTVVAFGTSAPELVASVRAALAGSTDMALGNVIGSNISNVALVLGIAATIRPLTVSRQITRFDAPLALGVSVLLVLLLLDGRISRIEGLLMFAGLITYVVWSVHKARSEDDPATEEIPESAANMPLWKSLLFTLVGLGALAYGADLFVTGARDMALLFGVSEAVIGLTVMAVGTSLPEIATVAAAVFKGMSDLIMGNAIGSNIFNILSVVGLSSAIVPLSMGNLTTVDLVMFVGMAAAVWLTMLTNQRLTRWEGIVLIIAYIVYVVYLF